jgi:hypothetical protein
MGRSGTSAVARMFASVGFFVGRDEELMEANEANPAGYWENLNVFQVNERILERLGGTWFDPPSEDELLAARGRVGPELRAVFEHLVSEADAAPLVIKDPRIGVMLPVWGEIIDEHLHPVLVIRDPAEIALSLERRDGTPTAFALASWQMHMSKVLHRLQGHVVTVAPYVALLGSTSNAARVLDSAVAHLTSDLAGRMCSYASLTAPDPALHRNDAADADHEQLLSVRQHALWNELAALAPGAQRVAVPESLLDCREVVRSSIRAETKRRAALQREHDLVRALDSERERTQGLEAQLSTERTRMLELSDAMARELTQAQDARAAQAATQRQLDVIISSRSWRYTGPLRRWKRGFPA